MINFLLGKQQFASAWAYKIIPAFFWPVYDRDGVFSWCGIKIHFEESTIRAGETLFMIWRRMR